jgi:hypothetical protein
MLLQVPWKSLMTLSSKQDIIQAMSSKQDTIQAIFHNASKVAFTTLSHVGRGLPARHNHT